MIEGGKEMDQGVILYIGGFELPDKNAAAHRVLSNAKILRKIGKKVVFIGVDKSLSWDSDILSTKNTVQGFEIYAIPYPQKKEQWIKYLTEIREYIKVIKKFENIEMIILYNFQAIAMKKFLSYCKKKDIKCCADITEWRSARQERLVYRILKDSDTWYRMKVLHKKLDGLIVISKYLEAYYSSSKNIVYVPTMTDASESKWKGKYEKSNSVLKLVYAGNPGRKDRVDMLIEALKDVNRKYQLDIIGITLEQYLEYYPNHSEMVKKNSNIVFHGRIQHIETLEYIKKANYSCFFREDDRVSKSGFPTKFAEAITCGTPVLTNKTSNLSDYIKNDENGIFIEPLDVSNIASVIDSVPYELKVNNDIFDIRKYEKSFSAFFRRCGVGINENCTN